VTAPSAKLLVCATDPVTPWAIMRGQLGYLASAGFDVVLVSAPGELLDATGAREGVRVRAVPMEREIHPRADARSLRGLVRAYRAERPDISMVSTPKAGLIAGLAAWITRVPRRIYMLRGLRLETVSGPKRWLLWLVEWISLHLAHDVVVVSPSLLARSRELHLLGRRRGTVLGRGASNGVDLERFEPTPQRQAAARAMRADLGIPEDAFVFGFVGRLTVDKGIVELVDAFRELTHAVPKAWLLIVSDNSFSGLPKRTRETLAAGSQIRFTGWLDDSASAYHAFECLVLPTHREGFPNVPLEAAAAAKPVITTTATGAVDSILPGQSGLSVEPRDVTGLRTAMQTLAKDPAGARAMGTFGKRLVAKHFANPIIWNQLKNHLESAQTMAVLSRRRRSRGVHQGRLSVN